MIGKRKNKKEQCLEYTKLHSPLTCKEIHAEYFICESLYVRGAVLVFLLPLNVLADKVVPSQLDHVFCGCVLIDPHIHKVGNLLLKLILNMLVLGMRLVFSPCLIGD